MSQPPEELVEITGRPITEEIQTIFGHFGTVKGVLVQTLTIDITYEDGTVVTFTPVVHPEKQS